MNRRLRNYTSLVTLLAFGAVALAPRLALADDSTVEVAKEKARTAGDERTAPADAPAAGEVLRAQGAPPPDPGLQQLPPAPPPPAGQPMPPGYYYPAPGYGQPVYPNQPPPGYYQPQPPRRVIVSYEERPRWGLFAGGLSMFLGVYTITALTGVGAGSNCRPTDCNLLAVPVLGPLFFWQEGTSSGLNALILFDTLAQAGGVAMLIAGLAAKKKVPIYQNFAVAPVVTPSFAGLSAAGRF